MNKEQLQQKVANMEAELAEMKALLNNPEPTINYWQPKLYDNYYLVKANGYVYVAAKTDSSENMSRVFKTETEAQKYADYVKAEETIRKVIAEANNGWLPNWSTCEDIKYSIILNTTDNTLKLRIDTTWYWKSQPNFMYIKNIKDAEQIITDYNKELITYLSY